jgi:hypothetical protein
MYLKKFTFLTLLVFLFSCSKHPLFLKKRYSSGYRLLTGKSELKNKKCTVEDKKHEEITITDIKKVNISSDNNLTADINNKVDENPSIPFSVRNQCLTYSRSLIETESLNNAASHSAYKSPSYSYKIFNKTFYQNQNKKNDSDTELIILVILSLFPILSLIAVYLKDGKKVTVNFWITLILHFLFFYWLFALLRVLDVINLA